MSILFLTSGLEPGRDGVGDYARLLAAECIRQKQACHLIALNDPYVSEPVEAMDSVGGTPILTLRLPARLAWGKRVERVRAFRSQHPCEWVSLQFVAYGFQRKGIVGNLARHLEPITAGGLLHIMFHELWIGVGQSPPLKHRIVGQIQRHYIQKMVRRLKPRWVTTSNPFYLSMLEGIGVSATEMPHFSNIPVCDTGDGLHLPEAMIRAGLCDGLGRHPDRWLGLFFGALHPDWKPEAFFSILIAASKKARKRIALVSAGRMGGAGEVVWKDLQNHYSADIDFIALGECSPGQISVLMQMADFGLAATPWHLIRKSGAAATMLDHGLPVIVTRADFQPAVSSAIPDDPLLHRGDAALESKLVAGLPRRPGRHRLPDEARDFIGHLMKWAPPP